jgi:hypothetical protein
VFCFTLRMLQKLKSLLFWYRNISYWLHLTVKTTPVVLHRGSHLPPAEGKFERWQISYWKSSNWDGVGGWVGLGWVRVGSRWVMAKQPSGLICRVQRSVLKFRLAPGFRGKISRRSWARTKHTSPGPFCLFSVLLKSLSHIIYPLIL